MGAVVSGQATPFLQDTSRYHRRAASYSFIGGVLFGGGWLILADAILWKGTVTTEWGMKSLFIEASPLLVATLFVVLLNLMNYDQFHQSRFNNGFGPRRYFTELWVWMSITVGVVAIAGSLGLLIWSRIHETTGRDTWLAGPAVVGTLFILVSGIVFWVGRGHESNTL